MHRTINYMIMDISDFQRLEVSDFQRLDISITVYNVQMMVSKG